MNDKKGALVTGANKGIGLQIARELAARDFVVFLGSRSMARGKAAAKMIYGDVRAIELDVTDADTIKAAHDRIDHEVGQLDVLVNNAGVSHSGEPGRPLADIVATGRMSAVDVDELRAVFETNAFGVVAVTQAMLPLLRKAPAARIINVSSGSGSLTLHADPANPARAVFGTYSASKAALNAITLALSIDLESQGITVHAVCPGFTGTDLNNHEGPGSVEDAAREPVRLALEGADGATGTFTTASGPIPW
jgi:NAD(P)-dependent dehydrogenase (short-subunit alcohol dehydrogenase family)